MVVHRRGLAQHHRDNAKDRDARARDCEVSESHLLPRIDGGWTGNPLSTPGRALMVGLARVVLFGLNNAASVGCTPGYEALGAAYLPARSCRSGWSDVLRPRGGAAAEQSRGVVLLQRCGRPPPLSRARARVPAGRRKETELLAASQGAKRPAGRRIGVITSSGGLAELILDTAASASAGAGAAASRALAPHIFQKATSSFRVRATIVVLRTRPPSRLTRSRYHWASAECGR